MISTPFGSLRIVDSHTHFFPTSFYVELGRQLKLADQTGDEVARRLKWDARQTTLVAASVHVPRRRDPSSVQDMIDGTCRGCSGSHADF